MSKLAWIVLLSALSLSAVGQATKDRNLAATRRHSDTTTVAPPRMSTGRSSQKDINSQLDKLERQTANTVVQPAAKSPKTPAYKLPAEKQTPTRNSYEQTMPVRAGIKNGAANPNANRSSHGSVKPYGR